MRPNSYANEKQFSQDQLAIQYLPAVKAMAYRMKERLPSHLEVSELISIGTEELIKLARRYDEGLNDSFWGYAKSRVYGAMLDYLRSLDVISRASRKLIKAIDMEVSKYFNEHEEEPSDEYLSSVLGESVEKIREAKIAADIYMLVPIDEQYNLMEPTNIIDIKEILNITESRISQITKEVIKKIRNSLGER